jgi:Dolichyl-phosphate-mannose-protein mannosyltransferase
MHFLQKRFPDRIGWAGPLVVSFLLKFFLCFQDAVINSDGVLYLKAAQMIAEGHFHQSLLLYPMPAYPLLIALVHCVLPDWILSAKLISLCTAAAITIPVYWLSAVFFNRKTAFYAAMAVAVLPGLNDIAPDVIRDPCFHLLACWSVYWMVKASLTERIRGVFGAFLVGGGALLFRIEAVFLFGAFFLYFVGLTIFDIERRQFAIKSLLLFLIPALGGMIVLLHVGSTAEGVDRIDQLSAFGRHILSGSFFERYQHIYVQLKESERLSPLPSGEIFKLARHYLPLLYFIGMLESFLKCLSIPYAALLWVARRNFLTVKGMPLVVLAILTHAFLVLIYFLHIDYLSSRYLLLSAFLVMPIVGKGMVMIEEKCVHLRWRKASLAIMMVIFLIFPVSRSIARGMGEDRIIAQTGRWFSDQSEVRQAGWAINDLRYYIYAGKPFNYLDEKNDAAETGRMLVEQNYEELENMVRKSGKGIIIIRTSKKSSVAKPNFRHFRRIKQFESHRSIVSIYADPLVLTSVTERLEGAFD